MSFVAKRRAVAAGPAPIYGAHSAEMAQPGKLRDDIRDRAAYIYATGGFPTHLRRNSMSILRAITASFQRPVALDGRSGTVKLTSEVVTDLALEKHPMVLEVRRKIDEGFVIQPSRGELSRRPFNRVFMYRRKRGGAEQIAVNIDGSVRRGW